MEKTTYFRPNRKNEARFRARPAAITVFTTVPVEEFSAAEVMPCIDAAVDAADLRMGWTSRLITPISRHSKAAVMINTMTVTIDTAASATIAISRTSAISKVRAPNELVSYAVE